MISGAAGAMAVVLGELMKDKGPLEKFDRQARWVGDSGGGGGSGSSSSSRVSSRSSSSRMRRRRRDSSTSCGSSSRSGNNNSSNSNSAWKSMLSPFGLCCCMHIAKIVN